MHYFKKSYHLMGRRRYSHVLCVLGCLLLATGLLGKLGYDSWPRPSHASIVPNDASQSDGQRTANIEDIQVGDRVIAQDPLTGEQVPKRVLEVYRRETDQLRILTIRPADGAADQVLKTTDEHPFWVAATGWVNAGDLRVGQRLMQSDGQHATLVDTREERLDREIPVFNFKVEDFHTYFASAERGVDPVLVHNADYRQPLVNRPGRLRGDQLPAGHYSPHEVSKRMSQRRAEIGLPQDPTGEIPDLRPGSNGGWGSPATPPAAPPPLKTPKPRHSPGERGDDATPIPPSRR